VSVPEPIRPAEVVAGFMASAAIAVSLIGVVHRPVRVIPLAIVVGVVAAAIGGRHRGLATFAVGIAAVCFVVGMTIAIATDRALY
jgi:hypothetical protein